MACADLASLICFPFLPQLICSRKNKTAEVKQRISDYLEGKDDLCLFFLLPNMELHVPRRNKLMRNVTSWSFEFDLDFLNYVKYQSYLFKAHGGQLIDDWPVGS